MINYLNKLMLGRIDHKQFNNKHNKKIKEYKTSLLRSSNYNLNNLKLEHNINNYQQGIHNYRITLKRQSYRLSN
jgi:hypothetical protein